MLVAILLVAILLVTWLLVILAFHTNEPPKLSKEYYRRRHLTGLIEYAYVIADTTYNEYAKKRDFIISWIDTYGINYSDNEIDEILERIVNEYHGGDYNGTE